MAVFLMEQSARSMKLDLFGRTPASDFLAQLPSEREREESLSRVPLEAQLAASMPYTCSNADRWFMRCGKGCEWAQQQILQRLALVVTNEDAKLKRSRGLGGGGNNGSMSRARSSAAGSLHRHQHQHGFAEDFLDEFHIEGADGGGGDTGPDGDPLQMARHLNDQERNIQLLSQAGVPAERLRAQMMMLPMIDEDGVAASTPVAVPGGYMETPNRQSRLAQEAIVRRNNNGGGGGGMRDPSIAMTQMNFKGAAIHSNSAFGGGGAGGNAPLGQQLHFGNSPSPHLSQGNNNNSTSAGNQQPGSASKRDDRFFNDPSLCNADRVQRGRIEHERTTVVYDGAPQHEVEDDAAARRRLNASVTREFPSPERHQQQQQQHGAFLRNNRGGTNIADYNVADAHRIAQDAANRDLRGGSATSGGDRSLAGINQVLRGLRRNDSGNSSGSSGSGSGSQQ